MTRRAAFHIKWESIDKQQFLDSLTRELLAPGHGIMDELVLPYVRKGVLTEEMTARRLKVRFQPREGEEDESEA